jgi:hypothetical protein
MAEKRDKNKDKSKKSDKGKEDAAKAVPSKEIPKVVEAVKAEVPSHVLPEPIKAKAKEAEAKPKVNSPVSAATTAKAPVAAAKTKAEAPKGKPEAAKAKAAAPVAKAGAAKPKAEAAKPVADRAKAALEKTAAKAAAIAEARKLALEKAQAELEARRTKWQEHKDETARAQAERLTKAKESRAQRDAERQKAREEAAKSAADRVAAAKAERDKATAERQKASQLAREEARAQAEAQRKARLANAKAPTSTAAVKPAAVKPVAAKAATKAVAAPAVKEIPGVAPVAIEIGYSLPAELKAELGKALKAGAKSTSLQVLGYFALPEGVDARLRGKLELARRKIAKGLEDAIIAVVGALVAEPGSASKLAFNPANSRVSMEFAVNGLNAALKRGLAAPTREITAQFAADVAAPKHFPALGAAVMLQFFGDLGTGQQLDGSLTFSAHLQKPEESTLMYIVSLGNSGKKSVSPNIKLQFSHDLGLSRGSGSLSASFVVEVPEEAAKN